MRSLLSLFALASSAVAFQLKSDSHLLTPHDLVTLPRVATAKPNPAGTHALSSVSVQGNTTVYLSSLLKPLEQEPFPVLGQAAELFWLSDSVFAYLDASDDTLKAISIDLSLAPHAISLSSAQHLIKFPNPVSDLTYHAPSSTLAFSSWVYADGNLSSVREQDAIWEDRGDDGLVYDSLFARHWDTWKGPKKSQIFTVDLAEAGGKSKGWVSKGDFQAPINSTNIASPSPDSLSSFELSSTHLLVSAKHPLLSPATHTSRPVYLVPLHSHLGSTIRELTSGDQGATSNVRFSPSERRVAWLEMAEDGYEADRNRLIVYDLESNDRVEFAQGWDTARAGFEWVDEESVLFVAGEQARERFYTLSVPLKPKEEDLLRQPSSIPTDHCVSSPVILRPNKHSDVTRVVHSRSSMGSPPESFVFALRTKDFAAAKFDDQPITNFTAKQMEGKKLETPESFYFEGGEGKTVQGWAIKPPGFKKGHKYPLAFLIHGGPQGAWEDSFSLRWNPQVFASQGFFVVAVNPTGSTTFGQDFTDAIGGDWGGRPMRDLLAGLEHVLEKYPEIDRGRKVGLGASWGGFAVNFIQGHNDAFDFQALVCHDGIFSTIASAYETEELYFTTRDLGSGLTPWEDKARYEKFNPANFVSKWDTPQLIIHGAKDFRLGESQGLSAFSALQQRGVPSRLLFFPSENHWVLNPGNSLKWHKEIFRWMDEWVGDASLAAKKADAGSSTAALVVQA